MRLSQIVEAEVDPRTGEVHRWVDRYKLLQKYAGDKSVFVHFSDVNKLGLNPSSTFDTPIGIYAYPVDYVLDASLNQSTIDGYDFGGRFDVPFAGNRDFIIIFRVNDLDKCWMIDQRTSQEMTDENMILNVVRQWVEIITERTDIHGDESSLVSHGEHSWYEWCEELVGPGLRWVSPEIKLFGCPEADKLAGVIGLDNSQLNAAKFLTIAYNVMHGGWDVVSVGDLLWRLCRTIGKFVSNNPAVGWSKILMKLGYNGVIDNGSGIIHPSEPTQAVFFRLADLVHLETIRNSFDSKNSPRTSDRVDYSLEAKYVRFGKIPDRVFMLLGRYPTRYDYRSSTEFIDLIERCGKLATKLDGPISRLSNSAPRSSYRSSPGFNASVRIFVDEFHEYRRSLLIFKHNSPEKYSEIRPQLLENFKNYKETFESYSRHEKMMPIVAAFNKLMRSV